MKTPPGLGFGAWGKLVWDSIACNLTSAPTSNHSMPRLHLLGSSFQLSMAHGCTFIMYNMYKSIQLQPIFVLCTCFRVVVWSRALPSWPHTFCWLPYDVLCPQYHWRPIIKFSNLKFSFLYRHPLLLCNWLENSVSGGLMDNNSAKATTPASKVYFLLLHDVFDFLVCQTSISWLDTCDLQCGLKASLSKILCLIAAIIAQEGIWLIFLSSATMWFAQSKPSPWTQYLIF